MAKNDAALGFFAGALDRRAQRLHHIRVEAVALVWSIQADQRNLVLQLVGDHVLFAHKALSYQPGRSRCSCAMESEPQTHNLTCSVLCGGNFVRTMLRRHLLPYSAIRALHSMR